MAAGAPHYPLAELLGVSAVQEANVNLLYIERARLHALQVARDAQVWAERAGGVKRARYETAEELHILRATWFLHAAYRYSVPSYKPPVEVSDRDPDRRPSKARTVGLTPVGLFVLLPGLTNLIMSLGSLVRLYTAYCEYLFRSIGSSHGNAVRVSLIFNKFIMGIVHGVSP